jgi:hypothetical protein
MREGHRWSITGSGRQRHADKVVPVTWHAELAHPERSTVRRSLRRDASAARGSMSTAHACPAAVYVDASCRLEKAVACRTEQQGIKANTFCPQRLLLRGLVRLHWQQPAGQSAQRRRLWHIASSGTGVRRDVFTT